VQPSGRSPGAGSRKLGKDHVHVPWHCPSNWAGATRRPRHAEAARLTPSAPFIRPVGQPGIQAPAMGCLSCAVGEQPAPQPGPSGLYLYLSRRSGRIRNRQRKPGASDGYGWTRSDLSQANPARRFRRRRGASSNQRGGVMYAEMVYFDDAKFAHIVAYREYHRLRNIRRQSTTARSLLPAGTRHI